MARDRHQHFQLLFGIRAAALGACFVIVLASPTTATMLGVCEQPEGASTSVTISEADTLRALIIFARFPDGEDVDGEGNTIPDCENCGPGYGWPQNAVNPPAWADSLIEDTMTPTIPGSLTHFFHTWSGGKHLLMGTVLDTVVVCDSTIAYYDTTSTGPESDIRAVERANRQILTQVDAMGYDFSQHNENGDDFIDFVFVNWRSTATYDESTSTFSVINGGASFLIPPSDTLSLDGLKVVHESGATVSSVSGIVDQELLLAQHRWQALALFAHEYAHDLTSLAGHDTFHLRSVSRYGIMQGNVVPGSLMMEGYLRDKLGWIVDPIVIDPSGTPFDTTITLSASYLDGEDTFAILRTHEDTADESQYFILEARAQDRAGEIYNTAQPSGYPNCELRTIRVGHGLLVTHITENGLEADTTGTQVPLIDIEVASGMFDLQTDAPNPVKGLDKINPSNYGDGGGTGMNTDLFKSPFGTATLTNIFAPFTNPSTALYRNDQSAQKNWQDVRSGITLYNIHWRSGTDSIRVSIRYDGGVAAGAPDSVNADMKFEGLVQLMGDVLVPPDRKLEIAPGAFIVAAANQDQRRSGKDDERVELIVKGRELAEGTSGSRITFTSSRDTTFAHFGSDGDATIGESTPPDSGNWYGQRFILAGCERTGFGYFAAAKPLSVIKEAETRYSRVGIGIEDFAAPSVSGLTFKQVTGDRHIYLDGTDVLLPYGYWSPGSSCASQSSFVTSPGEWSVLGKSHVVAKNSAAQDSWVGTSGKVDLIPFGKVFTFGSTAAGDSVYFRPETITSTSSPGAGADWGGALFPTQSSGSILRFADIGYAANPIFMSYPNGSQVKRSRIHDFAELGIWIQGAGQGGVVLDSSIVKRANETLFEELGGQGIYLDQSDQASVLNTTINLVGLENEDGGYALSIRYGNSFCLNQPNPGRDLLISNCALQGPGEAVAEGDSYIGLKTNWVCGSDYRDIDVFENSIQDWKLYGVELTQTADIQFQCNVIEDNLRGVDVFRDSKPTGSQMRFRENKIRATASNANYFGVRTNNNQRVKLGPDTANLYGRNRLAVDETDTKFIVETDADSTKVVNAESNLWFIPGSSADSLLTASASISSRLTANPLSAIDFTPFFAADTLGFCGAGGGIAIPRRGESEFEARTTSAAGTDLPTRLELGKPFPNPASGSVEVFLAIPPDHTGEYCLGVYDVRGRLKARKSDVFEVPGRFQLSWRGSDDQGNVVSPGVYFLRVSGPMGFNAIRRVAVVR